ncbi:branched-chain amino acid ABC transporter, periplasmic binding protein (braC-3) [Archaeoglobus fulgidus DSM 4304]|uniref:Branched-chain amino acid ABC transporter, periplasmic binding protein (BraC-3) n=3 Tax=Archaeoglobus fulgidus TaxID=2234 RepID=O29300_ARCFU|nr:branched-chain amino acid ABC transporter, periplasmic binding protein (braC-3) [Archaeoglobus fulgidus DSM 4304]AIG97835.1 ABC-type branched-chain amino acid transport system, periplasmic component [Archaeoglobus fulgidus DSM 8774]KUJ93143.1 MAG: Branched-chain amino acid ABC transporter, periplasmic binding protein (BraC-3) [Archaeoglobus fulgidus]KUK06805.1 MAG: Branched-chain amino acid ABC transporter, periplasmic binding protein (BraC-3) [Archaeoglobus fulgidus]
MKDFRVVFSLILLTVFILGCTQPAQPTQPQPEEKIKVGVLIPETGLYSSAGVAMKNAAELAAEHAGNVELVFADCGDSPEKAKTAFEYLVSQKVDAVVGAYSSPQAMVVADAAGENKVVYLVSVASTGVIEKKVTEGNRYVFRTAYNTTYWGVLAAEFLSLSKPDKYYFVGYDPLKTFNQGMLAKINELYGEPELEVYYKSPSVSPDDYKNVAKQIAERAGERDAIILGDPGGVSINFLKEYRANGGKGIIYSVGGALALPATLKKLNAGYTAFQAAALEETEKTDLTAKYFADYKAKFGEDANNYAGLLTYDSIMILSQAFEKGGKEKLIETLESGSFKGAAGIYRFNENHQALWGSEELKGTIGEFVNGKVEVVYPPEFATSQVVWPE